jgi:hypothetical protein
VPHAGYRQPWDAPTSSGHSCFAAGTSVVTRTGFSPIEDLRIGDIVFSQDLRTGALCQQPVLSVQAFPPDRTIRLDFDGEPIFCTDIHRFWTPGNGWVLARDLRAGEAVRSVGRASTIRSIGRGPSQPVFNIEVAVTGTFHVGKLGVLVHDATLVSPAEAAFDGTNETNPPNDQNE